MHCNRFYLAMQPKFTSFDCPTFCTICLISSLGMSFAAHHVRHNGVGLQRLRPWISNWLSCFCFSAYCLCLITSTKKRLPALSSNCGRANGANSGYDGIEFSHPQRPSNRKADLCPLWSNSGQTRAWLECPLSAKSRHRTVG